MRFDREAKLPVYARAGIVEFWLINLVERAIEVYREPVLAAGVYASVTRLHQGDQLSMAAFPDTILSVAELLSTPG